MQDVLGILNTKVKELAKENYATDDCPPEFFVSLIQRYDDIGKIDSHEIGLTIIHNGQAYTRTIFPVMSNNYGYPSLEDEMKYLYNNTM